MATDGIWDHIGYVRSSSYRWDVVSELSNGPQMPSELADSTGNGISHCSNSLQDLRDRGIVELLVDEDTRKGRYYGLTDLGEEVAQRIEEEGLVD